MDLQRLNGPPLWIGSGVVATFVLLFANARRLHLDVLLLALVLVVVVLGVVVYFLVRRLLALRAAEAIEHTLTRQADRDIERSVPGKIAEVRDLKADLQAAIEALKRANVIKRAGEGALAELPWYMLLGPEASGKSALVRQSGLHFALSDDQQNPRAVRGVGGARGFEWWLTEEGVLLAMSGKTLARSAFDDTDDWQEFLLALREQRQGRALNGVMVTVAVDQLADRPEAAIDALGRQVRERIRELVHHLGVVFPVYVVFTRCDRVAGFAEFFEDLTPEERRQVWGATLPLKRAETAAAEALFEQESQRLAGVLSQRRLERVGALVDPLQRARAFAFPLQFERLRAPLARFIQVTFQRDPVEEGVPLRGFYFTCAGTEGEPVDRVLAPAVGALGLEMVKTAPPPLGQGSWFAERLFTSVVFPDKALAAPSKQALRADARRRVWMVGGAAGLFVVLTLLFSWLSCANFGLIGETERIARDVVRISGNHSMSDLEVREVQELDRLRLQILELERVSTDRPFRGYLAFNSAGGLRREAARVWARSSADVFLGLAVGVMRDSLARGAGSFPAYFERYRVYRLLTDRRASLQPADSTVIAEQLRLALTFSERFIENDREELRRLVPPLAAFIASHDAALAAVSDERLALDIPVARTAAARVAATWNSDSLYRYMIDVTTRQLGGRRDLGFDSLVTNAQRLQGDHLVPGPFTREGWTTVVGPRIAWYAIQVERDTLLGAAFRDVAGGRGRPDPATELGSRYSADYVGQWGSFLRGIHLRPGSEGTNGLLATLRDLALPGSEIVTVLEKVRHQTRLGVERNSGVAQVEQDFDVLDAFFRPSDYDARLSGWARFWRGLTKVKAKPGSLPQVLSPTKVEGEYRTRILEKTAIDMDKATREGQSASTALSEGRNRLTALLSGLSGGRAGQRGVPMVDALLRMPLLMAQEGMRPQEETIVQQGASDAYQQQVMSAVQSKLLPYYPFSGSASSPDIGLADFNAFFKPGGEFDGLYEAALKNYVRPDGSPIAGGVPAEVVGLVKKCRAIQQAFFASGAEAALTVVATPAGQPEPSDPKLSVGWIALRTRGSAARYDANKPVKDYTLEWPGTGPELGASVAANLATDITTPGQWGFFRLVGGRVTSESGSSVEATWTLTVTKAGGGTIQVSWKLETPGRPCPFKRGFFRITQP